MALFRVAAGFLDVIPHQVWMNLNFADEIASFQSLGQPDFHMNISS